MLLFSGYLGIRRSCIECLIPSVSFWTLKTCTKIEKMGNTGSGFTNIYVYLSHNFLIEYLKHKNYVLSNFLSTSPSKVCQMQQFQNRDRLLCVRLLVQCAWFLTERWEADHGICFRKTYLSLVAYA